jgi:hypothetical protein
VTRARRYAFLLMVPLVPWLQLRVDRSLGEFRAQNEVLYLWSGEQVKRMFPGLEAIAGDLYWLRTVQYFGRQRLFAPGKRFELLEPLIEITVALDPRLEIAYRYGSIFLCEPYPVGAGEPEAGVDLLKRATERWPQSWELRKELGYFTYLFLGDALEARRVLLEASKLPGAPYWLAGMAGHMLTRSGERSMARQIWREMYDHAQYDVMRENAKLSLQRLDALDMVDSLERVVAEYEKQLGRSPRSLEELVEVGRLPAVPHDPTGAPFAYEPATGDVSIGKSSMLWKPDMAGVGR